MAASAYPSAVVAVRRVPRRFGDLSERGGQLVDIVALQRVDDPAIGAGFGFFFVASALVWLTLHAQHPPCDQVGNRRNLVSFQLTNTCVTLAFQPPDGLSKKTE